MANMKDVTNELRDQRAQILNRPVEFKTGSLSTVLRIGLEDLEATEKFPEVYKIDMGKFHQPDRDKCVVCAAGAVMAQTLGAKPTSLVGPCDYPKAIGMRLEAIDWARLGCFSFAAETMGYPDEDQFQIYRLTGEDDVTAYEESPTKFKADMRRHIATLVKAGY